MNYYIERRHSFGILRHAFYELEKGGSLDMRLRAQIKACREYNAAHRRGEYDYLIGLPCGMQDAHGMQVESEFRRLAALMLAYEMSKGGGKRLKRYTDQALGLI